MQHQNGKRAASSARLKGLGTGTECFVKDDLELKKKLQIFILKFGVFKKDPDFCIPKPEGLRGKKKGLSGLRTAFLSFKRF
ncbi:hypothetical protein I5M27_18185 [Adhaeribacter sp. BT258]|uniref:Uncharacterized protein n=1 Tax=Adhaeribacter terrigena TaxID=2793070 RepID=A0ABS1C6C3_9BACT|nr:hypothetical protein [Adhaeribacter terrigena]MBK0404926.1 hypothetical protein [Adhaeribacter terrigena]